MSGPSRQALGTTILLVLPVVFLVTHGSHVAPPGRNMMLAVRALGVLARTSSRKGTTSPRPFPCSGSPDRPRWLPRGGQRYLFGRVATRPRPMLFVIDRMVLDGMPYSLT
jgi:hypothetical protein